MRTSHETHIIAPAKNIGRALMRSLLWLPASGLALFLGFIVTGWVKYPVLSMVIFLPIVGALLLLFLNRGNVRRIKISALVLSTVVFLLCLPLYVSFDKSTPNMQFVEKHAWVPAFN